MGIIKRTIEEQNAKLEAARQIAVDAGVIDTCEYHSDVYIEGREDIESAYKLGNVRFTQGELAGVFESRREMTDLILEAFNDSGEECYTCARWRDE